MKQTQPNTTANKHGMLYDLEDKVPAVQSVIYGIQYLVYFLAGSAIMPVIIGAYLGLDRPNAAANFLAQRWRFHFAGNPRTPLSYY